jgi:hypothetical protein
MRTSPLIALLALSLTPTWACGDDPEKAASDTLADTLDTADGADSEDAADVADGDDAVEADTRDVSSPDTSDDGTAVQVLYDDEVQMVLGFSGNIDVDVPDGVVSLAVSVIGEPANYYGLASWVGPDQFQLVKPGWTGTSEGQQGLCVSCNNRISLSESVFAALAPNNPAARVSAGRHTFSLFGYKPPTVVSGAGSCGDGICHNADQYNCTRDCRSSASGGLVRVVVHAKIAASGVLPETGVLDLNLHFTGAQGLTAEKARTDADFQAILESMRTIYAQAGVTLGTLTYRDIDSAFKVIEAIDGEGNDLEALFATSEGNPEALNLFFVDSIAAGQFGGFGVILGISGGIPGPPLAQGTRRSGVAIAIKPVQGAPASVDTTMAHETGHFLGLFHTSEQAFFGPQIHDPLPDTPENDASYLMFNTGSGNKLSPSQGVVMRASPWVKQLPQAPGGAQ